MVLIDTNVLAYLLIVGDFTDRARELHRRDPDWRSESFIMVEFTNVLLRYMETRGMKLAAAKSFVASAEELLYAKLLRAGHAHCVEIADRYGVTAYDARFLAIVDPVAGRLVTEDRKLRAAAPALTCSLAEALAKD